MEDCSKRLTRFEALFKAQSTRAEVVLVPAATGHLVHERRPEDVASAVRKLLGSQAKRRKLLDATIGKEAKWTV